MKNTIKVCGFMDTLGSRSLPKKGMCSEARGSKWIEEIIHQYTQNQNTSGVTSKSL